MSIDYSTISLSSLASYPVIDVRNARYVEKGMGQGCHLDAPGYPSYFVQVLRNPYEQSADALVLRHPHTGRYHVLCNLGDQTEAVYTALYVPVSKDSLRFTLWEQHCYLHWYSCQYRAEVNSFHSHAWCGVDFRALAWAWLASADGSDESQDLYDQLVRHYAAWHIRKVYPDYTFDLDKAVYTPRNYTRASGAEIPPLTAAYQFQGVYYAFEHNNRWWERHASPRQVGIDGMERFPSSWIGK